MTKREKEKIEVTYLGWQEDGKGGCFLMVNEVKGHSTVTYDERLHVFLAGKD